MNRFEIQSFDSLWDSYTKCKRGVLWKPSTKHFVLNAVEEILRMETKLQTGLWKNSRPRPIKITYPKPREGLSIPFRDRVFQRSINDNDLYPKTTRSFIYDNCACQKGKGTDFARKRLRKHLWNFYSKHGLNGYILQIDIKSYYPTMDHGVVADEFKRYVAPDVHEMVVGVLNEQYSGPVGFNPGSQMVQIAGISVLNRLDHFIKEKLHCRYYIRYMDDFFILHDSREFLEGALAEIKAQLADLKFKVHSEKTHIRPIRAGFEFLGFKYKLTESGKIVMTVRTQTVKHERRKLVRMVNLAKKGVVTREKVDQCFDSWIAHVEHGNSWNLIRRMKKFYNGLWR